MTDSKPLLSFLRPDPDQALTVKNPGDFHLCNSFISHTFQACGRSFRDCGKYPQAIASYGLAIEFDDIDERVAEAKRDMHRAINLFFDPNLAERQPWSGDGFAQHLAQRMAVPDGYHVVGGGNILASYPATEEGLRAAIADADRVAKDKGLRRDLFHQRLTEDYKFDPVVYRCHERLVTKVHQAPTAAASKE